MEEHLHERDLECARLQNELCEMKKQYHRDKEALKKATKQHKDRAVHSERTLESVGSQLEEAVSTHESQLTSSLMSGGFLHRIQSSQRSSQDWLNQLKKCCHMKLRLLG